MSSMLVCAQPATGDPAAFIPKDATTLLKGLSSSERLTPITPASRLEVRPAPATACSGIAEIDALTGGLPRGCLTEIYGPASSGRMSAMIASLAAATQRGETCVLVDAAHGFDPQSAAAAGVNFQQLLWIRCHEEVSPRRHRETEKNKINSCWPIANAATEDSGGTAKIQKQRFSVTYRDQQRGALARLEEALRVTDLLLQSGGFGLVALDLGGIPVEAARRIPLTSWFRFRRAVENTPTILLVIGEAPCAGTCTSLLLKLKGQFLKEFSAVSAQLSAFADMQRAGKHITVHKFPNAGKLPATPSHAQLLKGMSVTVEFQRSRCERKPVQPAVAFETRTAVGQFSVVGSQLSVRGA